MFSYVTRRSAILGVSAIVGLILLIFMYMSMATVDANKPNENEVQYPVDPCSSDPSQERTLDPKKPELHIYKRETDCGRDSVAANQCVTLKADFGQAPICIYKVEDDIWISGLLAKAGVWEPDFMRTVTRFLQKDKSMTFLDIGCNIGVFTILAAKMGHKVVCVDANKQNLRMVARSLELGGLQQNVTLVWNALGQTRGGVSLQPVEQNVGGAYVKEVPDKIDAHSILLDDLAFMFGQEKVFIKMDVEGYEWNILQGGKEFFKTKSIPYIFMEWVFHIRNAKRGGMILEHMSNLQYVPHYPVDTDKKLETKLTEWPWETFWIKS